MDYSNILYYNQSFTTNNNNSNNNNDDQLMVNYNYYNNTSPNQHWQYQYQQNNTVNKQDLIPIFQYHDYSNVLQDGNFSIASYNVPEFTLAINENTYNNTQYYQSNLSPQLSECCSSASSSSYNNMYYYQSDPVFIDSLFPSVNENDSNKKKRKTTTLTDKRHICPVCSHRSKRKHNLVEHMLTHNPHRPKSFVCGHCARPFARKYDMKRHEKIHTRSI